VPAGYRSDGRVGGGARHWAPGLGYPSSVPEPDPDRLFTTGLAMGAASIFRAGSGCVALWTERASSLARLGAEAREQGEDSGPAWAQLRDELIAVARESSELAVRELQRGLEDLDDFTRPEEEPSPDPTRPYRAKP